MAATLSFDCPHCFTVKSGFTLVGEIALPQSLYRFHAFFMCNNCHLPVIAMLESNKGTPPHKLHGDLRLMSEATGVRLKRVIPESETSEAPPHCPESVARAFVQASNAIKRSDWDAAGAMTRRALELTTKDLAPQHAGKNLAARIDALAAEGLLTPNLKDWAHSLRFLGNDAVHEVDGIPEEEAVQGYELARFTLTYVYTLPTQVATAREMRAERHG